MTPDWFDRAGRPITAEEGAQLFESDDRRVALDRVGDLAVSTVFLVLNHSFDPGPPLLYETMVFAPRDDTMEEYGNYMQRYHTEEEARLGHQHIVEALKIRRQLGVGDE